MENELKKLSKWDVSYIVLSFFLWGVWLAMLGFLDGIWPVIGILGQGGMLLMSGVKIGRYKERCEADKKKKNEKE